MMYQKYLLSFIEPLFHVFRGCQEETRISSRGWKSSRNCWDCSRTILLPRIQESEQGSTSVLRPFSTRSRSKWDISEVRRLPDLVQVRYYKPRKQTNGMISNWQVNWKKHWHEIFISYKPKYFMKIPFIVIWTFYVTIIHPTSTPFYYLNFLFPKYFYSITT